MRFISSSYPYSLGCKGGSYLEIIELHFHKLTDNLRQQVKKDLKLSIHLFRESTTADPTVSRRPLNWPWCIIILYVGGDVTAAGYSGAPQHNTHTVTVVKIHSRRDGKGWALERFSSAASQWNKCRNMHGVDTADRVCNGTLPVCSKGVNIHERVS